MDSGRTVASDDLSGAGQLVRLSFATKTAKCTKKSEGESIHSIFVLFVVISFHSEHNGKAAARFMDGGISGMLSNDIILLTDHNIVAAGCECWDCGNRFLYNGLWRVCSLCLGCGMRFAAVWFDQENKSSQQGRSWFIALDR